MKMYFFSFGPKEYLGRLMQTQSYQSIRYPRKKAFVYLFIYLFILLSIERRAKMP